MYCDTTRLAPDIPVPVLRITSQSKNPGMAKNVERNIKRLHKACDLITNENWRNVVKTRYMHDKTNQAFFRVDTDHHIPRINVRRIPLRKYDIVAISDYNKGFLTEEDIAYICAQHPCVFVDTKKPVGRFLKDASFIKINRFEYERSQAIPRDIARNIICTKGGDPVEFRNKHYPVATVEVKDPCGAGDSFFAGLIVHYARGGEIEEAIRFANVCATHVVQHKGVSVIPKKVDLTYA